MRILVTGGAGFIGSHLTDRLLDLDKEVVGFDNLSSVDRANLARALENLGFRFFEVVLLICTNHTSAEEPLNA